jgi:hypothetical protein
MDWRQQYLRSIGAPLTASNVKFLTTWQRFEGGHTNNDASFNYLNTTYGKGFKSINSVGVRAYPDLQTGAQAFAQTLEGDRRYSGIVQGLRTGDPYALKDRVAAGLSTWLSGSPTKGLSYASKVLGSAVSPTAVSGAQVAPGDPLAAQDPASSLVPDTVAMNLTSGLTPQQQLASLVTAVASQPRVAPQPVPAAATPPSGGAGTGTKPGKWVTVAASANRAGMALRPEVTSFVSSIAQIYGKPLTIGTGTNHNEYVVGTHRESAHWTGWAADVPSSGAALTKLGQAALVAAGADPKWAAKQKGGLFNIGGYQVIYNTNTGGNHWNHLHVGLRGKT